MRITAIFIALTLAQICFADIPEIFVDPGACPGEGCSYGHMYRVSEKVALLERPSIEAKVVGHIQTGEIFLSQTGEVHTVPTRFEVRRESGRLKPGDEVYALTYGGEGYFRIYLNGELTDAGLGFSPWGGGAGKTCDNPEFCFGQLVKELEFTWWIFVLTENGDQGWIAHDRSMRWIQSKH